MVAKQENVYGIEDRANHQPNLTKLKLNVRGSSRENR
jgi:hypothetical protein